MPQASLSEITSADLMCERMAAAVACVSLPQSADSSLLNPLDCEGVWAPCAVHQHEEDSAK